MDDTAVTHAAARPDGAAASGAVAWAPDRAAADALAPYLGREVHVTLNVGSVGLLLVGILRQVDPSEYFVHGRPVGTVAHFWAGDVARVIEQDLPTAAGASIVVIDLRLPA